jgi:putative acetyltransferase
MDATIRPYRTTDAARLAELYYQAVRVGAARHYSAAQIAAWAPRPPDPAVFADRARDGRTTLVAVDAVDEPLAYGELEPDGHIDHLYCRPEGSGQGLASALCEALEDVARALGLSRLYVEASEGARGLFIRKGFSVVERREIYVRGVAIHHYRMEKRLTDIAESAARPR